nr:unnamed protein product [Callosobruchus chinensis]CAH7754314.1 unnamed protein product [Callosobruchus chinensis]
MVQFTNGGMTDMHFCYGMAQGRSAIVRTVQVDEAVLNEIERNPETSTRKIVHELNITHVTEWQILRHQQLYPYHMQRVHALIPRDLPLRVDFCNWLRNQILKNPNFLSQVLFTDEACFSGMPLSIFIANHVWSEDNPHAFRVPHTKEAFPDPCSYDIFFIFFRVLFVVKVC